MQRQTKKIKVIHIEAGRHLYGGALQVVYLLEALKSSELIENILICPENSEIAKHCQSICTVYPIKMNGDLDINQLFRIKAILKQQQADILHIHSRRGADIWGGLAAKMAGCKSILTRRVDNTEPNWWVKLKYSMFNQVIAISEGIRQVLIQEGLSDNQVNTIRSVVDTQLYQANIHPTWFLDTFNFQKDDFVIGVVAQLIPRKGHALLLAVFARLSMSYPNLKLLILGQGPLKAGLIEQVQQLGMNQKVHFAGFRNDLVEVLPNLDLLVHPAYAEGLGVSLLQASACEVAIVASAVGGIPEAVEHNRNGLLVPPGDEDALYLAIKQLLDNEQLRLTFAKQGREKMLAEFAIDVMATKYVNLYQKLNA